MDCLSQQLGEPLIAALRVDGLDTLRLINAPFDDVDELVTSLADPLPRQVHHRTLGHVLRRRCRACPRDHELERSYSGNPQLRCSHVGTFVIEHFARLAPHPALTGDVASAWVNKQPGAQQGSGPSRQQTAPPHEQSLRQLNTH